MIDDQQVTVVIPARNEVQGLERLLPRIRELHPRIHILVVDDGSDDDTAQTARSFEAEVVSHPYAMGNGAAVKSGVRRAKTEYVVLMDGDFQHDPIDIEKLLARLDQGYDLVVGARVQGGQASAARALANRFYNRLATWMVGHQVLDLTSGYRAARRERFNAFLHLLPNGFSYPATSTMAFFRAGHRVGFEPITVHPRQGGPSHIRPLQDGMRFLLIIFRIGTLYSPLKLFVPVALAFFSLGLGYYLYTFVTVHRFTNMSALLLSISVVIFLIGLVSEQITSLIYRDTED